MHQYNQPIMCQQCNHADASGNVFVNCSSKMGRKCILSDFERGIIAGARQADLSVSVTAGLLRFSTVCTTPNKKNPVSRRAVDVSTLLRARTEKRQTALG